MKYKVGDKVKVISVDEHCAPERTIGKIGKIVKVDEKYKEYKVYLKNENTDWRYFEEELESVEEKIKGEKTMKYKVGDLVKVRSDLKVDEYYEKLYFAPLMKEYIGKIYKIKECCYDFNNYLLEGTKYWKFNDEMLEAIEEKTEEKNQFKKGDKVRVARNGKYGIIGNLGTIVPDYSKEGILRQNYKVEYIGNNLGDYDYYSCLELRLVERKQLILDEVEKKYLAAVIKPFKKYVDYIEKVGICSDNKEFIRICIKRKEGIFTSEEIIMLPNFKKETMYKNMKSNKKYNLNELDLI